MGDWIEVKPPVLSICNGCQMGHCAISQKVQNGKLYTKTDDCHETCQRYKDWFAEGYKSISAPSSEGGISNIPF